MSIVAYIGLPGSGKSYGVVEQVILPACRRGREIWTNIPIHWNEIVKEYPNAKFRQLANDDVIGLLGEVPPGAVIVLDEVARFWPSGLPVNKVPTDQLVFFTEHRHKVSKEGLSQEIVLVTQSLKQVATFIRENIEETFVATKLSAVGASKRFRVDIYQGVVEGRNPPKSQRTRQVYGKYNPEIYRFYKSHTQSQATGAVEIKEEKLDKRNTIFGGFVFQAGAAAAVALLAFGLWGVYGFFSGGPMAGEGESAPLTASAPVTENQPQPTGNKTAPVAPEPVEVVLPWSEQWRLTGIYGRRGHEVAVFSDANTGGAMKIQLRRACDREIGTDFWVCEWEGYRISKFTGMTGGQPSVRSVLSGGLGRVGANLAPEGSGQ